MSVKPKIELIFTVVPMKKLLARSWDRNLVRPSVCLSVTRVLCDQTKEHTAIF